ncbi:MAG: hypothetical protein KDK11_00400 [Maritimibacter sp.]|nr:hypothetical protein [Maritimibacter sp.]
MKVQMNKFAGFALLVPAAAQAHPGHPELPGPAGHDLAHMALALSIAALAVAGLLLLRRLDAHRQEE